MTLKDRFRQQDEDERIWYDRAFGPSRNMMNIRVVFRPPVDKVKKNMFEFFIKFGYSMFPEMQEEFSAP